MVDVNYVSNNQFNTTTRCCLGENFEVTIIFPFIIITISTIYPDYGSIGLHIQSWKDSVCNIGLDDCWRPFTRCDTAGIRTHYSRIESSLSPVTCVIYACPQTSLYFKNRFYVTPAPPLPHHCLTRLISCCQPLGELNFWLWQDLQSFIRILWARNLTEMTHWPVLF